MIQKRLKANIQSNAIIDVNTALKQQVDTNTINIQTNTQKINDLEPKVQANQQGVATNAQDILDLTNRIDNLPAVDLQNYYRKDEIDQQQAAQDAVIATKANITDVVDLTTEQTITGFKKFNNHIHIDNAALKLEGIQSGGMIASTTGDIVLIPAGGKNIKCASRRVRDVGAPVDNTDATNKSYVDTAIANIDLTNYYTKAEIDASQTTQDNRVDTIQDQVNQNTTDIGEKMNTVDANNKFAIKGANPTGTGNTFSGQQTIKYGGVGGGLIIQSGQRDFASYIEIKNFVGEQVSYFGRPSGRNYNLEWKASKPNANISVTTLGTGEFLWNTKKVATEQFVNTAIQNVDLTNYYTKGEVYSKQETYSKAESDTFNQQQDTKINQLIEENKKQVNIVFEIIDANTYNKGDQGYKGTQWYLCLVNGSLGNQTGDATKWKPINYQTQVDLSNYYTKPETTALLNNKANDNQVVKLEGGQTINGAKTFTNSVGLGTNFELTPETGAMRIAPKVNGKWLYFGSPNTEYFAGIDLNNRVNLNGIKTPTQPTQAANKQYVDNAIAAIPAPDLSNYYTKPEADGKYALLTALDNYYNKTQVYTKQETDNKYLDKTREGVLPHKFTIQSNDENLKLKSNETARSVYIGFYKGSGNERIGYMGRTSGANHHMEICAEKADGNISLKPGANGSVVANDKKITRVANPSAGKDAANKEYVDNAIRNIPGTNLSNYYTKPQVDSIVNGLIAKRAFNQRFNQNQAQSLGRYDNKHIVGIEAYRKRTDSRYQFRMETGVDFYFEGGELFIYPKSEANYTDDWKIYITYMNK